MSTDSFMSALISPACLKELLDEELARAVLDEELARAALDKKKTEERIRCALRFAITYNSVSSTGVIPSSVLYYLAMHVLKVALAMADPTSVDYLWDQSMQCWLDIDQDGRTDFDYAEIIAGEAERRRMSSTN